MLGFCCCAGFFLVAVSKGYSPVAHCGGFSCCGAQALGCTGSIAVANGLSCSVTYGIFLDQGSPASAGGFFTTEPPGNLIHFFFLTAKIVFLFVTHSCKQL